MNYTIEVEQEADGRWLAEVPELPGVLAYGATVNQAQSKAEALALRVLAERLETQESKAVPIRISLAATANVWVTGGAFRSKDSKRAKGALSPSLGKNGAFRRSKRHPRSVRRFSD